MTGPRVARAFALAGAVVVAAAATATTAAAQGRTGGPRCMKCHGDSAIVSGRAASRRQDSSLFVPADMLENTAHARLACGDCHRGQDDGYPHRARVKVAPCETCHEPEGREWAASVHAVNAATEADAPSCVGCHGAHRVYAASDARSPTYPLNVAATCGRCHNDPRIVGRYFSADAKKEAREAAIHFPESVHGVALSRSGLLVAATCSNCHRAHLILPADSARSSVSRANMPATCGTCHAKVRQVYDSSAHGARGRPRQEGDTVVPPPVCADCHSAHGIVRADQPEWLLRTVDECGTCHKRVSETYYQTYHGKVTRLGYGMTVAKCSDCHTAHDVRAATDTASSVNRANLARTCATCHPGANDRYVQYYSHGDYRDRKRYPAMFYVWLIMTTLLVAVWTFWAIHTVMWFVRLLIDRRRRRRGDGNTHRDGYGGSHAPVPHMPGTGGDA